MYIHVCLRMVELSRQADNSINITQGYIRRWYFPRVASYNLPCKGEMKLKTAVTTSDIRKEPHIAVLPEQYV